MARLHGRVPRGERCRAPVPPPDSPDFNPIGMTFSKIEAWLRNAVPRTVEHLWDAIAEAIDNMTPQEAHNFFSAAGYEPD